MALMMVSTISAQNIIDEHFSAYKAQEDYTKIHVTGKMFQMASDIEIETDSEEIGDVQELLSGIKSFSMIMGPEESEAKSKYLSGAQLIQDSHEELMSVDDQQGSFSFYIDEVDGIVNELVMIGAAKGQFMVATLNGQMNLKKLGQITKQIRQEGFGPMSKVFDHGADEVKLYPNPASLDDEVKLDIPENLIGGQMTIFDLSGAVILKEDIGARDKVISTSGLTSGQYVVELEHDNVRIKKKMVIR